MEEIPEKDSYEFQFERRFFDLIMREVKAQGINYRDFAELVWGGKIDAPADKMRTLTSIRKAVPRTGKPQALKLREACRMAQVLGLDMARLVWEVERYLDARGVRKVVGQVLTQRVVHSPTHEEGE